MACASHKGIIPFTIAKVTQRKRLFVVNLCNDAKVIKY